MLDICDECGATEQGVTKEEVDGDIVTKCAVCGAEESVHSHEEDDPRIER